MLQNVKNKTIVPNAKTNSNLHIHHIEHVFVDFPIFTIDRIQEKKQGNTKIPAFDLIVSYIFIDLFIFRFFRFYKVKALPFVCFFFDNVLFSCVL